MEESNHLASMSESTKPTYAGSKWMKTLEKIVDNVVLAFKRRSIQGSGPVATQTAELLRQVVAKGKFSNVQDLITLIKQVGRRLSSAQPMELAIGNVVRRVLYIVRQESASASSTSKPDEEKQMESVDLSLSLHRLLDTRDEIDKSVGRKFTDKLKQPVIDEISDLMEEMTEAHKHISDQAREHIHAKEVILTFGVSRTVLAFLKEAAQFRKFEVIVAESAPSFEGQKMAVQLAELVETTVITDSAVFAMMAHVNKVIIGTQAVLANGGLLAHTGGHNIALAAKHHSVPVMVITGLHKLCPLYAFDQDTFNENSSPSQVLKFEEMHVEKVNVMNPSFDYIPPELVTLFITNFGGYAPSYVYRLLAEYYDAKDYEL